jgi:hypothetical protein
MSERTTASRKALPEPWADLAPLLWRLDQHAPVHVRVTQTWRQALQSRGELVIVHPVVTWASIGCLMPQLRPSEGGHPISGIIILALALSLWLLMSLSLSAADALWDLIAGPYLRGGLFLIAIVIELALIALLERAPLLFRSCGFRSRLQPRFIGPAMDFFPAPRACGVPTDSSAANTVASRPRQGGRAQRNTGG